MHDHLEIIIPPTNNISEAIYLIMTQFNENKIDIDITGHEFWDWYVIGGRFSGTKELCRYDSNKVDEFYKKIEDDKITVSGVICGKHEIKPADQIPKVDRIWNDMFPTEDGSITPCPLFAHSNNQYDSNDLLACDICKYDEIPEELTCSRVIFAGPWYEDNLEAKFMLSDSMWNGVNFMDSDWDGKVHSAITKYKEKISHYRAEYTKKLTPTENWICVTVDYHS